MPKVIQFYKSAKAPPGTIPIPLPASTSRALTGLFVCACIFLISTIPLFGTTNIFQLTQSRLQAPTPVLFNRLAAIRPLTAVEDALQATFKESGLEARLAYLRFGPDVIANCRLTDPRDAGAESVYLFYALPSILAPHIAHLLVLGIATSGLIAGRDASRWRLLASVVGFALAVGEVVAVATYNQQRNAASSRPSEIDWFFWKIRLYRGLCSATVDGVLGRIIYMSATKQAFIVPKSSPERIEETSSLLENALAKTRGLGIVRNTTFRDTSMRQRVERYWIHQEAVMRAVFEESEVTGALNEALQTMDVPTIAQQADGFVEGVLGLAQDQPDQT